LRYRVKGGFGRLFSLDIHSGAVLLKPLTAITSSDMLIGSMENLSAIILGYFFVALSNEHLVIALLTGNLK